MRRAALVGAALGAAVVLPAVFLALVLVGFEPVLPLLVPGALLVRPLGDALAQAPGVLGVGLVVVANAVVYGATAAAVTAAVRRARSG